MGHEGPDRSAETGPGRRPDVVEARPLSGPTAELATLDALAERAAKSSVDSAPSPALRASSVQRLQLRAGNAAVAAMLQRRAAPSVRKPAAALQRKPAAGAGVGVAPVARPSTTASSVTAKADAGLSGSAAMAEPAADLSSAAVDVGKVGAAGGGSSGLSFAPAAPPPPPSAPVVQRSFASMLAEARKRAAAPSGPEDTRSVEGDTDLSDFTDRPDLAKQERAAIPPPPLPPKPAIPAALGGKVGEKPPPKPPKRKVGKSLVAGPKGRPPKGGPGAKGGATPGEIVKKPAPPLPPKWKKPAPGKPVAEIPAAPAPVGKTKPNQDPAFAKVVKAAGMTVKKARKHPTGKKESESAQAAAVPPGNDIDAQAKAKRADTMATAKPKPFDEEMFVTAVKAELAKTAPKNLSEAGDVGKKAADAKGVIGDKVGVSKEAAAGDVEQKSKEPPNPGDATPKPVTPMAPLEIEKAEGMKASAAMPAPVPSEAIDMREGPAKVDNEMGEAGVTEEQLAKSNEPEFTGALDAKKEGEEHSAAAPGEVRKAEGAVLKQAGASAAAVEKQTVSQANSSITDAIGKISGQKNETKSKDELKRKEVADKINSIFDKTKSDVDGVLKGLDEKVDAEFKAGEAQIRASFTADWKARLGAYKDDRYSGLRGKYRWVRDKFKGLPQKANQLFDVSRKLYEDAMDKLVRRIATIVTQELTKATVRIEQGRGEVSAFVSTLKGDLAKFGQEAADEVTEKFGNLDSAVKDKFDDMASNLAKKYAESRDAVNTEIEDAKEANKGLIDKAIGAVKAVIKVIGQLKDMVLTILSKIADVIGKIIADPIGFLKRFLSAVGDGIARFAKNIGDHLQKGLMGWLFGQLGAAGIEIPKEFSLEAMLKLAMSILGFTKEFVLQRLEKKVGPEAFKALTDGADIVKNVITGGPGVLWEMLKEKFNDFQSMVVDEIKGFITEKVVKAGISWILGLLTPAGAFIKACQAIYSIVMFFVERGSEIKEFVESVIDTAGAVARGESGGIPEKIEGVLAKLLPLAISFLASLLNLGGVGTKIRETFEKVQKPIGKAMDKVLDVILTITAPVWKPIAGLYKRGKKFAGKVKDKAVKAYETGKAKVKEVGANIKNAAKSGVAKVKKKVKDVADWGKDKAMSAGKKVKDTATAAKNKVVALFKKQEKGFNMGGEKHTLKATPDKKGRFAISMASVEEPLSKKIGVAIASLEDQAKTAQNTEDLQQVEAQIKQLREIAATSKKLEQAAVAAGGSAIGPNGAPPGFAEAMTTLAQKIEAYGAKNGVKDITKATEGAVTVDLRLLSKFGLPMANYLQAQKVADDTNTPFDIRATNLTAAKLYEKGANPKSAEFKQKTINDSDLLLGAPVEHLGKVAWFLPSRPHKPTTEKLMGEEGGRSIVEKWWGRWKQRKEEYYEYEPKLKKKLKEGEILIYEPVGSTGGGVIRDALNGLPFTGDHDLYAIHGNPAPVIRALEKPPFNVQHGAHVDWPRLPEVLKKGGLDPAEAEIYNTIIKAHAPGGEALIRINPKGPPAAVSSSTPARLKGEKPAAGGASGGGAIDGTVVKAADTPQGFAGLVAAEKRVAEEVKEREKAAAAVGAGQKPGVLLTVKARRALDQVTARNAAGITKPALEREVASVKQANPEIDKLAVEPKGDHWSFNVTVSRIDVTGPPSTGGPSTTSPATIDELKKRLSAKAQEALEQQQAICSEARFKNIQGAFKDAASGTFDVAKAEKYFVDKWMTKDELEKKKDAKAASITKQVDDLIAKIGRICEQTTPTGRRAGASRGDGTTEGGVKWEAEQGVNIPGSPSGHISKVETNRNGLKDAVESLRKLEPDVTDSAKKSAIAQAIVEALARAKALETAFPVWNSRILTWPAIWHPDGESKVQRGWPPAAFRRSDWK